MILIWRTLLFYIVISLLSSCSTQSWTSGDVTTLRVDYSSKVAKLGKEVFPCRVSRKGVGGKSGSNCTPLGEFVIIEENHNHAFGSILRLGGISKDGYQQGYMSKKGKPCGRGILLHKYYGLGTRGCITFEEKVITILCKRLKVGDRVIITY
jgi:L,D-peptidoglycan transpeptidase YkuD (ErfK/YbiS/YcfS/YnhG family)